MIYVYTQVAFSFSGGRGGGAGGGQLPPHFSSFVTSHTNCMQMNKALYTDETSLHTCIRIGRNTSGATLSHAALSLHSLPQSHVAIFVRRCLVNRIGMPAACSLCCIDTHIRDMNINKLKILWCARRKSWPPHFS